MLMEGVLCSSLSRITENIAITKWHITYFPHDPVSDYIHMLNLNTRLCVDWKTLPNLKFQTKISNSNFKLKLELQKTKIFPDFPGNPGF